MKKRMILINVCLYVITMLLLFVVDNKLFYYGKNNLAIHMILPFHMAPEYWSYDMGMLGFVLVQDGETVVAKGKVYWNNPNVNVKDIIRYGFNNVRIAVLVNDSLDKEYYVICEKKVGTLKEDFSISIIKKADFIPDEQLKWIPIKNISTGKMEMLRNYLEILLIIWTIINLYILFFRVKIPLHWRKYGKPFFWLFFGTRIFLCPT